MIKRIFWEKVAENWSKEDSVVIPDTDVGQDIPDDFFDDDEILDLDDLLMGFGNSEDEEIDFFSI